MSKKISVTNPTAGKLEMLIGNIGMVAGFITGIGGCTASLENGKADNCMKYLITGGVIVGVSLGTYFVGKVKHWYYND